MTCWQIWKYCAGRSQNGLQGQNPDAGHAGGHAGEVPGEGGLPGLVQGGGAGGRSYREHLEVCQGYAFLRAGKDLCVLKDRTRYSMAVMTMRIGK